MSPVMKAERRRLEKTLAAVAAVSSEVESQNAALNYSTQASTDSVVSVADDGYVNSVLSVGGHGR